MGVGSGSSVNASPTMSDVRIQRALLQRRGRGEEPRVDRIPIWGRVLGVVKLSVLADVHRFILEKIGRTVVAFRTCPAR